MNTTNILFSPWSNSTQLENLLVNLTFASLFLTSLAYWVEIVFFKPSQLPEIPDTRTGVLTPSGYVSSSRRELQKDPHQKPFSLSLGKFFMICSNLLLVFLLISRWENSGHFPLSNLYESLIFLSWTLSFLHLSLSGDLSPYVQNSLGCITAPLSLLMNLFAEFSLPQEMQKASPLVPALQSNWLTMHVTVMIISYGCLILGSAFSVLFLILNFTKSLLPLSSTGTPSGRIRPFTGGEGGSVVTNRIPEGFTILTNPQRGLVSIADAVSNYKAIGENSLERLRADKGSPSQVSDSALSNSLPPVGGPLALSPEGIRHVVTNPIQFPHTGETEAFGPKPTPCVGDTVSNYLEVPVRHAASGESKNKTGLTEPEQGSGKKQKRKLDHLWVFTNLTQSLDTLSYRFISLGFPFLSIGILSGAVWANEAWGSYWSWDPKETWALLTWLVFAVYLHARLNSQSNEGPSYDISQGGDSAGGQKDQKPQLIASAGFFLVWFCYLGVNLIGEGLHSYGFFKS